MQVVRLELIVLEGVVKVGEALVDDWQNSDAVEQKRPGEPVSMTTALPFAGKSSGPTGHYAVCATDCLILYIPRVRPRHCRSLGWCVMHPPRHDHAHACTGAPSPRPYLPLDPLS